MTKFIDEFFETSFPPERIEQQQRLLDAMQNLAELELPLTEEQRERAARIARERGWVGPMPWEPGYVKGDI